MADEINEPDPDDLNEEERREFLMLLANGKLEYLNEMWGREVTPRAIQYLAIELCKTSIELMTAREELENASVALEVFGSLSAGLMGMAQTEDIDGEDDERRKIRAAFQQTGINIRTGAFANLEAVGS